MTDWEVREGDCLELLREVPSGSVNCCVTSPPYWGLRDYGTGAWEGGDPECEHKREAPRFNGPKQTAAQVSGHASQAEAHRRDTCGKCGATRVDQQLGLERTPEEYVSGMVAVFEEVRRVLRDDGCCFVNLGDSYASGKGTCYNPGGGENSLPLGAKEAGALPLDRGNKSELAASNLKPKDLCGIPWRVAFALQAAGWWLRSDIIWAKPNPMPESVTDRPTRSHEYVFLLTKSARYWWDQEAVREPQQQGSVERRLRARLSPYTPPGQTENTGLDRATTVEAGRNIRSVWTIATQAFPEAHFATFPEKLVEPCVRAGCPAQVCVECGAPWERVVVSETADPRTTGKRLNGEQQRAENLAHGRLDQTGCTRPTGSVYAAIRETEFDPTCYCGTEHPIPPEELAADPSLLDDFEIEPAATRPGLVLDPFCGSGTTGVVALCEGRRFLGIELSPEYAAMARRRLGEAQPPLFAG